MVKKSVSFKIWDKLEREELEGYCVRNSGYPSLFIYFNGEEKLVDMFYDFIKKHLDDLKMEIK
jgi:hypothetical protein